MNNKKPLRIGQGQVPARSGRTVHLTQTKPTNQFRNFDQNNIGPLADDVVIIKVNEAFKVDGDFTRTPYGQGDSAALQIKAPKVTIKVTVNVSQWEVFNDQHFPTVETGFIQTIQSLERVAVYKKDGTVVAERVFSVPNLSRDQKPSNNAADPNKTLYSDVNPPWYSDNTQLLEPAGPSLELQWEDQPSLDRVLLSFAGGRLAELRGKDQFVTSVVGKRNNVALIQKGPSSSDPNKQMPFKWGIDWSATFDNNGDFQSKALKILGPESSTGLLPISDVPAWQLVKSPLPYRVTLTGAMAMEAYMLWEDLAMSRWDGPTANNIEQALRTKNPSFRITISMKDKSSIKTQLQVFAGCGQKQSAPKDFRTDGSIEFNLNDIVDLSSITSQSLLDVWVGGNSTLGDTAQFSYPFWGTKNLSFSGPNGGDFLVKVARATGAGFASSQGAPDAGAPTQGPQDASPYAGAPESDK
jgi:hypothetical protein